MNAKQRELQTVQLTYQRNGRLPLTVREMETGYRRADYAAVEAAEKCMKGIGEIVFQQCEEIDRLKREIAWLSAKLDTYERPHDLVRGN